MMEKEYFIEMYEKISLAMKHQFTEFSMEFVKYEVDEDNEKLYGVDAVYKLIADKKFINLWFGVSIWKTKPFAIKVAINDNKEEYSVYGFPLDDYLTYRDIDFDRSLLFRHLNDYEEMFEVSNKFFQELKKLIATEEMQKLLYTDYKIDVPRDWSFMGR